MTCDSSMVALMICFITVLWSRWLVCNSVKSGWRLFVSRKPLQPTCMVCRVACLPLLCATSSRWRYLLSFLSRELKKLFSQQIVSSKMCRRPGESTTRSGLRSVGRSAGSWYGCSSRSTTTVVPFGQFSCMCWCMIRRTRSCLLLYLPCWSADWQWLSMCASFCLFCCPSLRQMGQRSELSFLHVHRLVLCGRESTAAPMAKAK